MLGIVQLPPAREASTGGQDSSTHQSGRPDVAVNSPLVADTVGQPGFAEQLVEFVPVLLRYLGPDIGGPVPYARGVVVVPDHGSPNCAQERVWQLEGSWLGDIETIERAIADKVEVAGHGCALLTL
jgi:hypothetical protein